MKKLTSLLIFVGLAFNVSGQEKPKNLKEVLQADWLVGSWETKNADGQVSSHTFSWKIEDVLMVKEYRENGELRSFAIISLDTDDDKVLTHSYGNRRTSVGELKVEKNKVFRTSTWKSKKLSGEQIQSRVESIVANQLASGAIQEAGVPELKQNIRNYFQRTSGANKYTYEKQGEDKMVMTRASKNTSGEFVEREPVTLTRKKE
jgi:hypothetical protein|tara:strand:+ start:130 stop:741 length:612 start_codon:yes stop_codon:yes gene_type:complete